MFKVYEGILGRFPDEAGFKFWSNQLSNGSSLTDIVGAFTKAAEFNNYAVTNKQFVDHLYDTALQRNPDVSGETYWISNLETGKLTKLQVAVTFIQSSEFNSKFQKYDSSAQSYGSGSSTAFSTSGSNIIDSSGTSVNLDSANWFGAEGTAQLPQGLYNRGYEGMLDAIQAQKFDTVRLPFSQDTLTSTSKVIKTYDANGNYTGLSLNGSYINPWADRGENAGLEGLTPLQIMDEIVQYADKIGLKIVLDHHRMTAGDGGTENGLWYIPGSSTYTVQSWQDNWEMLAARYAGNKSVIGADLQNEPYQGTWGDGGTNDWAAAATQMGNLIHVKNPNWLIFVEGTQTYNGQSYFWGGNLMGVQSHPITLNIPNKVVYSPHDYGPSVANQSWFSASNYPDNLPAIYDQYWGYIYKNNIAPIWVGEMGGAITTNGQTTQAEATGTQQYLSEITTYMKTGGTMTALPTGKSPMSWAIFAWNNINTDVQGIMNSDWTTINTPLYNYLKFS